MNPAPNGRQAPNNKHQEPNKNQYPNIKTQNPDKGLFPGPRSYFRVRQQSLSFLFGAYSFWSLVLVCYLVLVVWYLLLGAYPGF
jgi:hypothetical protein